jgi:hypothetical protein
MNKKRLTSRFNRINLIVALFVFWGLVIGSLGPLQVFAQSEDNPNPPDKVVKLIFIHHSTGENWLTDGYGNLGKTLDANNYFVSDTNYGWGPNSIGDRTDIPNWLEWFASPDTPTYMTALLTESGQNSNYTRTLSDPGGENKIIMFKSCFPNSQLEGNPNDPPTSEGDALTVANAKYVYNEILKYFKTRPDKLFVVITAPPLSDPTFAANARAFNNWLVDNWLTENNYPDKNVAVWDFFNVLTSQDNHHRFINGTVEHSVNQTSNIEFYPSSDEHPSPEGSQKATNEFIPMLNVFYHRWQANLGAGVNPPPSVENQPAASPQAEQPGQPQGAGISTAMIDNFEGDSPAGTNGWEAWMDEATKSTASNTVDNSVKYEGNGALRMDYNVASEGWADVSLLYENPQNWQGAQGLTFAFHGNKAGLGFDVVAHGGTPDQVTTYAHHLEVTQESVDGWTVAQVPWNEILRVAWEPEAGTPVDPNKIMGIAFAFDQGTSGSIWVDDVQLMGLTSTMAGTPAAEIPMVQQPTQVVGEESTIEAAPVQPQEQPTKEKGPLGGLCSCPGALLVAVAAGALWMRRAL